MSIVPATPSINLSRLTKLEEVVFESVTQNLQWIAATLQTAESKDLWQVTIRSHAAIEDPVSEPVLRKWRDLDHFLLRFWTLHSVRLKIAYRKGYEGHDLGGLAPMLLPELTGRGAVDLVESSCASFSSCSPPACLS